MRSLFIAMLLATTAAFAAQAQTADKSGIDPAAPTKRIDRSVPTMKFSDLGIDISRAGTDKASQQRFVEALPSDQQSNLKKVCVVAVTEPENQTAEVVHFCKNVTQ